MEKVIPLYPIFSPESCAVSLAAQLESSKQVSDTGSNRIGILRRDWITLLPIVFIDLLCLCIPLMVAKLVLLILFPEIHYAMIRQWIPLAAITLIIFPLAEVYAICGLHPSKEFRSITLATVVCYVLLLVANQLFSDAITEYETALISIAMLIAMVINPIARVSVRSFLARRFWWGWPAMIVGDEQHAERVQTHFRMNPILGIRPIAFVNDEIEAKQGSESEAAAKKLMSRHGCNLVVIAAGDQTDDQLRQRVDFWTGASGNVVLVPTLGQIPTLWVEPHDFAGTLGLRARAKLLSPWRMLCKRCLDLVLAVAMLPVLVPIFVLVGILIKYFSPGPIFFAHERIGRNGNRFQAWKFRSMVPNANQVLEDYLQQHPDLWEEWNRDHKLKNDPRIVPGIGSILRKLSLDELPQIWNVLRGDMSLVGPRPIVEAEITKYRDVFPLYLKVTPGITGLWQVSGRNNTTYEERIAYDAYYVRNWSPWLDIYILARTIRTVLLREGAY